MGRQHRRSLSLSAREESPLHLLPFTNVAWKARSLCLLTLTFHSHAAEPAAPRAQWLAPCPLTSYRCLIPSRKLQATPEDFQELLLPLQPHLYPSAHLFSTPQHCLIFDPCWVVPPSLTQAPPWGGWGLERIHRGEVLGAVLLGLIRALLLNKRQS